MAWCIRTFNVCSHSLQNVSVKRTVGQCLFSRKQRRTPAVTTVARHCDLSDKTGPGPDVGLSLHLVSFAVSNVKPFPMGNAQCTSRVRFLVFM